jgi:HD-GYP domain-containing protein (c-di-GMP phosphodiesterase class II)
MDETEMTQGSEARRLSVPASLFVDGPQPPFVLFDRRGRVADLLIARSAYVAPSDMEALEVYLRKQQRRIAESRRIPAPARAWALHRVLVGEAGVALRALPDAGALMRLTPIIELTAAQMAQEPGVFLAEVAHSVQSPATHAVATALYALTLATAEGIDDRASLVEMGLAGVLADVSKLRMPKVAMRPDADLAGEELDLLHAHPELAADLLHRAGMRTRATLDAVRLHHERWDGGGYPKGLRGTEIPMEARILRVADAYAALTVDRPDVPGMRGYEALLAMAQSEGEFEPRLLRSYVRALGRALSVNARWTPPDERETHTAGRGAA